MAAELGGYFRTSFDFNPGKAGKYPLSSALHNVDNAGEPKAACAKATSSAGVAESVVELAEACCGIVLAFSLPTVSCLSCSVVQDNNV